MIEPALISYSVATLAFLVLSGLLLTGERRRVGGLFLFASAVSTVWAIVHGYQASSGGALPDIVLVVVDALRAAAWFAFLVPLLGFAKHRDGDSRFLVRAMRATAFALPTALVAMVVLYRYLPGGIVDSEQLSELVILGHLVLAVFGLVLVEQIFRNANVEQRWALKFLCFAVGGIFAYDFYLYSDALLFKRVSLELWGARGIVNAVVVPLMAVSAARNPDWSGRVFVSRHVVFHGAALLGAGVYLMLMAGAGYYIRARGGEWGGVLQAGFFFGALIVLGILMMSGRMRSQLKVFIAKHFFRNKYDYREEWLRFANTLSSDLHGGDFRQRLVRAIAEMVESPGGSMWAKSLGGSRYSPVASWNAATPSESSVSFTSPMVRFLEQRQWVVDLNDRDQQREDYEGFEAPSWLSVLPKARFILPLLHHETLEAFIVLNEPRVNMNLNWEDHDLLKTVGRQAASYLRLIEVSEALADARQFETFNRLSAYVVHDLKNLVAQLSLVVVNAKKHIDKPEFIQDAIHTVDDAVSKMNRMLAQLRKSRTEAEPREVTNITGIAREVVRERSETRPVPRLNEIDTGLSTVAEPDRLAAVLGHVIQNAQEACQPEGTVEVSLRKEAAWVIVEIEDNGCGMDEVFLRDRLFRPFDTTKGNAGMGVGAYECREFVRAQGGEIDVSSRPGGGTKFRIRLPKHEESRGDGNYVALSQVSG